MGATDTPKLSPAVMAGPFGVVPLISEVLFTVPSAFISITCTAPVPSPWRPPRSPPESSP